MERGFLVENVMCPTWGKGVSRVCPKRLAGMAWATHSCLRAVSPVKAPSGIAVIWL